MASVFHPSADSSSRFFWAVLDIDRGPFLRSSLSSFSLLRRVCLFKLGNDRCRVENFVWSAFYARRASDSADQLGGSRDETCLSKKKGKPSSWKMKRRKSLQHWTVFE